MLLGSDRPSLSQEVQAYRVLARVSPASCLPRPARALVSYGYEAGDRGGMEPRLARHAEAADAARRIDADDPNRAAPLFDDGVALARRVPEAPETIARSLTDRAMFLAAADRYREAHADCTEAVALLDGAAGATRTPIVTRT